MPRRSRAINPHSNAQRTLLRLVGGVLTVVGGIFALVGFASFFSAFGGTGAPDKFWCVFVGLPMLGFGMMLLKMGFLGTAARYVAGEVAPVATDTLNYVADETHDSVRKVAGAVASGMRDAQRSTATPQVACRQCGHDNDHDARFCDQCGGAMAGPYTCPQCRKVNDTDARFCDGCGTALA